MSEELLEKKRVAGGPLDAALGESCVRRDEHLGESARVIRGSGPRSIVVSNALVVSARQASSSGSPSTREVMTRRAGCCATVVVSLARCPNVD
jgi:hypothetical protein